MSSRPIALRVSDQGVDPVPDANWTFREALTKAVAIEVLFLRFDRALKMSGDLGSADHCRGFQKPDSGFGVWLSSVTQAT
jgi:hypothetical protein